MNSSLAGPVAAPAPLPPTGAARTFRVKEDASRLFTAEQLLAGWSDPDGTALSITALGPVTGGRAVLNADGSIRFRGSQDLNGKGAATITYTITDATGQSTTTTAVIDLTPVNDAPVLVAQDLKLAVGTTRSFSKAELLAGSRDPDGAVLDIVSLSAVRGGRAVLNADDSITFTATPGLTGDNAGSFRITVRDAGGIERSVVHTVDLLATLTGPGFAATLREDAAKTFSAESLLQGWTAPGGAALSVIGVSDATGGTARLLADGSVRFTPTADLAGKAAAGFTLTVADASGKAGVARAVLDITAVNDAPVVDAFAVAGHAGSTLVLKPADILGKARDADGDALRILSVTDAQGGEAKLLADGTLLFTPDRAGTGSVLVTVADPSGATGSGRITIDAAAAPDGQAALPQEILTPGEYLRSDHLIRPIAKEGHRLEALTTFGYDSSDTRIDGHVALSDIWGYALEISSADAVTLSIGAPSARWQQLVEELRQSPEAKIRVYHNRDFGFYDFTKGKWQDAPADVMAAAAQLYTPSYDFDGKLTGGLSWNYLAPQSALDTVAKYWASKIALAQQALAPLGHKVDYVLDQGEWGPLPAGSDLALFYFNPAIRAVLDSQYLVNAAVAPVGTDGLLRWNLLRFNSEAAAKVHGAVLDATLAAVPQLGEYIYYANSGSADRYRYAGWIDPGLDDKLLFDRLSTNANAEVYYWSFNDGWIGEGNIVRKTLNAVAQQIGFHGATTAYNWVTSGWWDITSTPEQQESWTGFLKLLYLTGQVGANAGWYDGNIAARDGGDVRTEDRADYLDQIVTLGQVNAAFTWLDDFILDGRFLPGPDRHYYSKDLPAYEFPVYENGKLVDGVTQPVHALARINAEGTKLLVSVWAADAHDRTVTVDLSSSGIAGIGRLDLQARQAGTIYIVEVKGGQAVATLLDTDPLHPSIGVASYFAGHDLLHEGSALADTLLGGDAAPEAFYGFAGHDRIEAGGGDDTILGGDGNDTLIGGRGNDSLEGGDGQDLAVLSGRFADWKVEKLEPFSYRLTNAATGEKELLCNVEWLQFDDRTVDALRQIEGQYDAATHRFKLTAEDYAVFTEAPREIFDGYQGFQWDHAAINSRSYGGRGDLTPTSGVRSIAITESDARENNDYREGPAGSPLALWRDLPFTPVSVNAAAGWRDVDTRQVLTIRAYADADGAQLLGTQTVTLSGAAVVVPIQFDTAFAGAKRLTFSTNDGDPKTSDLFGLDDLVIAEAPSLDIQQPATVTPLLDPWA